MKSTLLKWWLRLPTAVTPKLRTAAWASFVSQVLIIATGGAVRLTSSGLGCPTWPLCTPDSLVTTPEMGFHGIIEFGNRTLTGLVGVLALIVFLMVVRFRKQRPDLCLISYTVLLGVVAQAIVGGITVITGLNPFIVGFHYLASTAIVCLCAAFLVRLKYAGALDQPVPAPRGFKRALIGLSAITGVVLILGVLTTGAGPHSGDAMAGRNGFDAVFLQHVHAWPSYLLMALTFALMLFGYTKKHPLRGWLLTLLCVQGVQALLGIYQARNGLPELVVGVHMVLASLLAATTTVIMVRTFTAALSEDIDEPAPLQADR
ncbi:heme A synthase [Glutamicibacter sp. NPDC087344]|uniref:COX15/CtaA family protein n=1 Tax=Glutamicibacter sp. NPDC087344 TaxID=3363994 RepID=UPI00382C4578